MGMDRIFAILIPVKNEYLYKAVDCHIMCTHLLHKLDLKSLVLQSRRKEHRLAFGSFIQLMASLHQSNRSYPTRMMYSHESSILWRPKAALSRMSRM